MHLRSLVLFLLLLIPGVCSAGTHRVVFVGDSITAANIYDGMIDPIIGGSITGYAPKLISDFATLYPTHSFTGWNEGGNGYQTTQWVTMVTSHITSHTPDIVCIMLGANDAALDVGISLSQYETNLRSIITQIQAWNIATKILLLTPTPIYEGKNTSTRTSARTTAYAQKVRDVVTSVGGNVSLVETSDLIIAHVSDNNYSDWWYTKYMTTGNHDDDDGIHPMQSGHNVIYNAVSSAISAIVNPAAITTSKATVEASIE